VIEVCHAGRSPRRGLPLEVRCQIGPRPATVSSRNVALLILASRVWTSASAGIPLGMTGSISVDIGDIAIAPGRMVYAAEAGAWIVFLNILAVVNTGPAGEALNLHPPIFCALDLPNQKAVFSPKATRTAQRNKWLRS
jgi:hypothetical protein